MRRFRRGDQQLARHAPDPGTSGAVRSALDHDHALAMRFCGAICGQPRCAGANHGYIGFNSFHFVLSSSLAIGFQS